MFNVCMYFYASYFPWVVEEKVEEMDIFIHYKSLKKFLFPGIHFSYYLLFSKCRQQVGRQQVCFFYQKEKLVFAQQFL